MARTGREQNITLSVIDRLIDTEPANQAEGQQNRSQALRQLKASLKRDLEWLLNTRRTPEEVAEASLELQRSLYNYGLPDISGMGVHSSQDQNLVLRMIEAAVSAYEPRIQGARVTLEPAAPNSRTLRFQIQGLLRLDPAPERVTFDTVLELASGEYEVKGG
jgi:type VI secretion system protein ImpF